MTKKKGQLISVIVPTKNRSKMLGRVLRALYTQNPGVYEIAVVDTGSGDSQKETEKITQGYNSSYVRYFSLPSASASHARNYGIKHTKGDIVAFLDDDAVPQSGWTRAIYTAVSVGPFWFRGQCIDASANRSVVHGVYRFYKDLTSRIFIRRWASLGMWKGYQLVDMIQAGNFFVRRSMLEKFHPVFDEQTFPFVAEEIDLAIRIRQSGGQILYVPGAAIKHYFLRLGYRSYILYSGFWYGRAAWIFQSRKKRVIASFGSFGKTAVSQMHKKRFLLIRRFISDGYTLFRDGYAQGAVYNFLFILICISYLMFWGAGYLFGVAEHFMRQAVVNE